MVRQMRSKTGDGKIGKIQKIILNTIKVGLTLLFMTRRAEKGLQPENPVKVVVSEMGTHAFQMNMSQ